MPSPQPKPTPKPEPAPPRQADGMAITFAEWQRIAKGVLAQTYPATKFTAARIRAYYAVLDGLSAGEVRYAVRALSRRGRATAPSAGELHAAARPQTLADAARDVQSWIDSPHFDVDAHRLARLGHIFPAQ